MNSIKGLLLWFGIAVFAAFGCQGVYAGEMDDDRTGEQSGDLKLRHFSGLYGGFGIGFSDFDNVSGDVAFNFVAGYRYQFDNNVVFGIEGFLNVTNSGGFTDDNEDLLDDIVDVFDEAFPDGAAGVFAKLGYATSDKVLVYGGLGFMSVDRVPNIVDVNNATVEGLGAELGVEWMPTDWFGLRFSAQRSFVGSRSDNTFGLVTMIFSF